MDTGQTTQLDTPLLGPLQLESRTQSGKRTHWKGRERFKGNQKVPTRNQIINFKFFNNSILLISYYKRYWFYHQTVCFNVYDDNVLRQSGQSNETKNSGKKLYLNNNLFNTTITRFQFSDSVNHFHITQEVGLLMRFRFFIVVGSPLAKLFHCFTIHT